MATHILEENERLHTGWIVLSRSQNGQLEYLTPAQISARSVSPRLVVLSGCSSGKAEVRTASGLMGLTRAWIAAGAGSVLATRWPTVDDDGAFFESFYRNYHEYPQGGPAGALHRATLEMIHSETWRAKPSFWAGYFLVGNN
jgi:CHAT domain-containing protein